MGFFLLASLFSHDGVGHLRGGNESLTCQDLYLHYICHSDGSPTKMPDIPRQISTLFHALQCPDLWLIDGNPQTNTPTRTPCHVRYDSMWSGDISWLFVSLWSEFSQEIVCRFVQLGPASSLWLMLQWHRDVGPCKFDWCFVGLWKIWSLNG